MKKIKEILETGKFASSDLEALFSELSQRGHSLMIRSDVVREEKLYTCAIAVPDDPEKSARRDAASLSDAVVLCLNIYVENTAQSET